MFFLQKMEPQLEPIKVPRSLFWDLKLKRGKFTDTTQCAEDWDDEAFSSGLGSSEYEQDSPLDGTGGAGECQTVSDEGLSDWLSEKDQSSKDSSNCSGVKNSLKDNDSILKDRENSLNTRKHTQPAIDIYKGSLKAMLPDRAEKDSDDLDEGVYCTSESDDQDGQRVTPALECMNECPTPNPSGDEGNFLEFAQALQVEASKKIMQSANGIPLTVLAQGRQSDVSLSGTTHRPLSSHPSQTKLGNNTTGEYMIANKFVCIA